MLLSNVGLVTYILLGIFRYGLFYFNMFNLIIQSAAGFLGENLATFVACGYAKPLRPAAAVNVPVMLSRKG